MQVLKSMNRLGALKINQNYIASAFKTINNPIRTIHLTNTNLISKEFEEAKSKLSTLTEDPGSDVKLRIYGLFKQATVGKCTTSKPSMVDFVGRAKWNAWSELDMSQSEAESTYINLINDLLKNEAPVVDAAPAGQFKHLLTSIEYNNIYKIVFNRPTKYNAINIEMYNEIIDALNEANANPSVAAIVITGAGEYYCSGNDLTSFSSKEAMANMQKASEGGGDLLEKYIDAYINLNKPLISLVNGPAVGISVTLLGLHDLVIASDKATFIAPFTKIAQAPEACSSYTFPKMMGQLKASEFLMFNRQLNAHEAYERNLVTEVIPDSEFQTKAWAKVEEISKLPKESLRESRALIRDGEKEKLREVNRRECEVLVGRWKSSEFVRVIMEFMSQKKI